MNTDAPYHKDIRQLTNALNRLPRSLRGHVVAVIGEFVGTMFFLFFAYAGTQVANISSNPNTGTTVITKTAQMTPQQLLYISLSFGFSLAVNAWVYFRISGGLFNPAVTLGMVLIGAITWVRGILLFIAQMVGAIVAAYLVQVLFTGGLNVSTTLSATTTVAQGVIIEMLLTTQLVFTIFMLAAEKHTGNFIAPVGIGLSLFIAELTGVFWTGGSLNPARSFAPAVAIQYFHSTQWIYWVGPLAGSCLAVVIFKLIKVLEYETANPDPEAPVPTGPVPADLHREESETTAADIEKAGDVNRRSKYASGSTLGSTLPSNINTEREPTGPSQPLNLHEPYGGQGQYSAQYVPVTTNEIGQSAPRMPNYRNDSYPIVPGVNSTHRTNAYTPSAPPRGYSNVSNPAHDNMQNILTGPSAAGSTLTR